MKKTIASLIDMHMTLTVKSHFLLSYIHICTSLYSYRWICAFASMYIATFLLHSTGPPVNVTCNIFINSFGSVTETTMVSVMMPLATKQQYLICHEQTLSIFLFIVQLAGPPVNVTCNIFINSFGSIAETTMVSGTDH